MKLRYVKSAGAAGWSIITAVLLLVLPLLVIGGHGPVPVMARLFVVIAGGAALVHAVKLVRGKGCFVSELTSSEFVQESPLPELAESFRLRLEDITGIECDSPGSGDGDSHWFLRTERGRHRITPHFGNPVLSVVNAIERKCPPLKVVHRDRSLSCRS